MGLPHPTEGALPCELIEYNEPIELKIKTLHLGAEARIIKGEERRLKARIKYSGHNRQPELRNKLHSIVQHRKHVVRPHARSTNLAYGYLKGNRRDQIENPATLRTQPRKGEVQRMIERYGTKAQITAFNAWWDDYALDENKTA